MSRWFRSHEVWVAVILDPVGYFFFLRGKGESNEVELGGRGGWSWGLRKADDQNTQYTCEILQEGSFKFLNRYQYSNISSRTNFRKAPEYSLKSKFPMVPVHILRVAPLGGLQGIQPKVLHMTGKVTEPPPALGSHYTAFHKYLWLLQTVLFAHTNGQWALSPAFFISWISRIFTVFTTICVWIWALPNYIVTSICYEYLSMFLVLLSFKGFPWNSQEQHCYTRIYKSLTPWMPSKWTISYILRFHLHLSEIILTPWNKCIDAINTCQRFSCNAVGPSPRFPSVFFTISYCFNTFSWVCSQMRNKRIWSPRPL